MGDCQPSGLPFKSLCVTCMLTLCWAHDLVTSKHALPLVDVPSRLRTPLTCGTREGGQNQSILYDVPCSVGNMFLPLCFHAFLTAIYGTGREENSVKSGYDNASEQIQIFCVGQPSCASGCVMGHASARPPTIPPDSREGRLLLVPTRGSEGCVLQGAQQCKITAFPHLKMGKTCPSTPGLPDKSY